MIKVWVLIAYMWTGYSGGPLVIDNIASESECERLAQNIRVLSKGETGFYSYSPSRCVEVWKVK